MPPRLQMPNYMGYAQGASQIAQGIGGGMDLAIKNAGNREQLDAAIKGLRSEYIEQAKAVGLTQEEINAGIAKIRNPTRADYSNPEPYLNQMKDVTTAIFTPLAEKKAQARGQTSQRMGQQALGMGLRTEGYTGGEQVGAAPAQAESAAPGMYRSGAPEGTQVGGFQAQQPQLGMQQVEERPETREAATAKFAQGEEGFIPTPEEVTQFKGGLGQAVPTTAEQLAQQKETRLAEKTKEVDVAAMTPQNFDDHMKKLNYNLNLRKTEQAKEKFEYNKEAAKLKDAKADRTRIDKQIKEIDTALELTSDRVMQAELKERKKDLERSFRENESGIDFIKLRMEKAGKYTKVGGTMVPSESAEPDAATKLYQMQAQVMQMPDSPEKQSYLKRIQDQINAL